MNTVAKGDEFENVSFKIIKEIIDSGKLGLNRKSCKIYQRKAYYSKDREANIVFDIAVEVFFSNQSNYYLLLLVECKNYSKNIPVDDLEEFINKTKQVAGNNVKSIFITTKPLSKGAFNIAKNRGVMVIQVGQDLSYELKLNSKNHLSQKTNIYRKNPVESILQLLELEIKKSFRRLYNNQGDFKLSSIDESFIKRLTEKILRSYAYSFLIGKKQLNINKLLAHLQNDYNLKTQYINDFEVVCNVLGMFDLNKRVIHLSSRERVTDRGSFIAAHEIGHFFLHSELTMIQEEYDSLTDNEDNELV